MAGDVVPELKQILGAMIFGANRPLSMREMHRCLAEVAEREGGAVAVFAGAKEADLRAALEELAAVVRNSRLGFVLTEIGGGYRFQSEPGCGLWLRYLLDIGKPQRLSMPALETLAVIAYRQPIGKAEIEAVRGVNVDHIIRMLLELQLVRITGRSELPGRPFLYGTTRTFLEHFGLRNLKDLADMEPMLFAAGRRRPAPEAGTASTETGAPSTETRPAEDAAQGEGDEVGGPEEAD